MRTASIYTSVTFLNRPCIVAERLGGFYVVIRGQGWLHGSRADALRDFAELERTERGTEQ